MNGFTWALLAALALVVGLQIWRRRGINSVSAADVQRRLEAGEKLLVVDVREPHEFRSGHIPGAKSMPLSQLKTTAAQLDRNAEIVLVCASGNRSVTAYQILAGQGFARLLNLTGGMFAWKGKVKQA